MTNASSMINALTYGLGPELGKAVRIEYYKIQARIKRHTEGWKIGTKKIDLFDDLIALACFRDIVLLPAEGSADFVRGVKTYEIQMVQMGAYSLDVDYVRSVDMAVRHFYAVLNEFGIDTELLDTADTKAFVGSVFEMIEKWEEQ